MGVASHCVHLDMPELQLVEMDIEMPGYRELERVKDRGMPYWWLWAGECPNCGQHWLVAQEERMNDFVALRRMSQQEWDELINDDVWPTDFDRYETLLRLGKSLKQFHYLFTVEHLPHIIDLARERPGISVGDLAWLWNLELSDALALSQRAVSEAGVDIDLQGFEHT